MKNDYTFLDFGRREDWDRVGETWHYAYAYKDAHVTICVKPDEKLEMAYKGISLSRSLTDRPFSCLSDIKTCINALVEMGDN